MIDIISPMIKKFLPFAKERMGFENPPRLFLKGDSTNAEKVMLKMMIIYVKWNVRLMK